MHKPTFVLHDPELIKEICIKKFDHFTNHIIFGTLDADKLFNGALFLMKDQRWKDMRATLTPAFTNSKMRLMWTKATQIGEKSIEYLTQNLVDGKIEIDAIDFYSKITIDIISACAFGLMNDSVNETDNQIHHHVNRCFVFNSVSQMNKFILATSLPKLANLLKLRLIPKDTTKFFTKLIRDIIDHRQRSNDSHSDILELLIKALENSNKWSHDEIASQFFLPLFIAASGTTATILNFGSYELAINPDIQDKLYDEIKAITDPISFDTLQNLPYLNGVVSEILRKHPPAFILDRVCSKDIEVSTDDGEQLFIPGGSQVWISVFGMHYDYRYFPQPEKFMPERFALENRDNIIPGTYIPFGFGPRMCIGARFAMMELKVLLYQIVKKFYIEPCKRTRIPLQYDKGTPLKAKEPIIVQLRKR